MGLRSPGRGVLADLAKLVVFCVARRVDRSGHHQRRIGRGLRRPGGRPRSRSRSSPSGPCSGRSPGSAPDSATPARGALYWIQPGTTRQPPWPTRIPSTAGGTREFVDAALYLAVLLVPIGLLTAGTAHGHPFDTLPPSGVCALLGCLALLGLRDGPAFRAARPEFLVPVVLAFAFEPGNLVFAVKLALVGFVLRRPHRVVARVARPVRVGGGRVRAGARAAVRPRRGAELAGGRIGAGRARVRRGGEPRVRAVRVPRLRDGLRVRALRLRRRGDPHLADADRAAPGVLVVLLLSAAGRPVRRPVTLRPMPGPRPSPRPRPAPALRPQPQVAVRPRPTPRPSPGIIGM